MSMFIFERFQILIIESLAEYYGNEQHHKFKVADGKEVTVSSNAKSGKSGMKVDAL